jgi:ABC-type transporter Mla subunit MlaD
MLAPGGDGSEPVRLLGVTGSIWNQRGQRRQAVTPAIARAAEIAPEVSREMDDIDRVVNDLGDAIRNDVRDEIGKAIAELEASPPQDQAHNEPN